MFAGRRRRSSNVRVMQLFHELKQQFPTVPDHIVSACIASHAHTNEDQTQIRDILEAAAAAQQPPQEPMGRSPPQPATPTTLDLDHHHHPPQPANLLPQATADNSERPQLHHRSEMNDSDASDFNRNVVKSSGVKFSKKFESVSVCTSDERIAQTTAGNSSFFVKRPNHLAIKPESLSDFDNNNRRFDEQSNVAGRLHHNIQLSEKCKDVHKLLNSDNVITTTTIISDKPPRSPLTNKRLTNAKNSPIRSPLASPDLQKRLQSPDEPKKKETASTPTQTTDTLLGGSVNLSLNVNCSMDLVQSPTRRKSSCLQLTPEQPWLQEPQSPRSYTSVNLTLRPPSAEPQAPIDITSQNSSLTYSTSSFDSQKGLQSRLQITVGPGGGSVSSVRTRPRSSYHPEQSGGIEDVPVRAGSLTNLAAPSEPPVVLKQQARIERLRIELRTEKAKLQIMKNEIAELEGNKVQAIEDKIDAEVEKQLRREIKHLQYQCERLALETDKSAPNDPLEDFYHNIYTGQRLPLHLEAPVRLRQPNSRGRMQYNNEMAPPMAYRGEAEGPKWNCNLCTFLNHPDLDKCEQCEMPRILHGKSPSNPNIVVQQQQSPQQFSSNQLVPSQSLPNFLNPMVISRPIGFDLNFIAESLNNFNIQQLNSRPN